MRKSFTVTLRYIFVTGSRLLVPNGMKYEFESLQSDLLGFRFTEFYGIVVSVKS
jgi:hypothetical protein